jgi:hypothetical protein
MTPDLEDFKTIFEHFVSGLPPDAEGTMQNARLILSEWIKFCLNLNIEDEDTRNTLIGLMFDFTSQIHHSYVDYKYLLKNKEMLIDSEGNIKNASKQHKDLSEE